MTKTDAAWRTVYSTALCWFLYKILKYMYSEAQEISVFQLNLSWIPIWRLMFAAMAAVAIGGALVFLMLDIVPGSKNED